MLPLVRNLAEKAGVNREGEKVNPKVEESQDVQEVGERVLILVASLLARDPREHRLLVPLMAVSAEFTRDQVVEITISATAANSICQEERRNREERERVREERERVREERERVREEREKALEERERVRDVEDTKLTETVEEVEESLLLRPIVPKVAR